MNSVIILRFAALEGPGFLAPFLENRNIPRKLVAIDKGEAVPTSLSGMAGLVLMGGPMSVNDSLPWIAPVVKLVQQAMAAHVPVLGHCLGAQLMARAMGATITPNPVPEFGWHPVKTVLSPETARWLADIPEVFPAFHWHGETFSRPKQAARLLTNHHCKNQGFVYDRHLALQCHIEMTEDMVRDWARQGDLPRESPSVQSPVKIFDGTEKHLQAMHEVADALYERWIENLIR